MGAGGSWTQELSAEEQHLVKTYLNRVFTVLSAKIRARVLQLKIPEAEKREVLKEFIHLTDQEQESFLEELEALNA